MTCTVQRICILCSPLLERWKGRPLTLHALTDIEEHRFQKVYQRCEGVDEQHSSWQFSRSPVHDGVRLDVEGVSEVDYVERVGIDGKGGGRKDYLFSFLDEKFTF